MLGVAAEQVLLILVDQISSSLSTQQKQEKFTKETKGRHISTQYAHVLPRLKSPASPLPKELEEVLDQQLGGIFNLIRRTRNDAGHPTGKQLDRTESHALLELFPTYCATVYNLIEWLKKNKI